MTEPVMVDVEAEMQFVGLSVGDVVWLRSGGPGMTVESVGETDDGDTVVAVSWLATDGTPYDAEYPIEMIMQHEGNLQ